MPLLTSTSLHSTMASDTPWWMQCSVFDELLDYEPSPSPKRRPAASRRVQLGGHGGWRNRGRTSSTVATRPTYGPPRHPPRLWQAPLERRRRAQAQTAGGSAFWAGAAQAIAHASSRACESVTLPACHMPRLERVSQSRSPRASSQACESVTLPACHMPHLEHGGQSRYSRATCLFSSM